MQQSSNPQQHQQERQQNEVNATTAPLETDEPSLSSGMEKERRLSDEWDAAKVPPSRFQKRKGSIYATPCSRDGLIEKNYAERYHAKIAEMRGDK